MRALFTLLFLLACTAPATAFAAPADDALAALREMRVLNYRIQTRYHVGALAAGDEVPFRLLKQDVQRFDAALTDLQAALAQLPWNLPLTPVLDRWQSVRWFAEEDLPTPLPEILPREITYDRARRPASIAAMRVAGRQLAAALDEALQTLPAAPEPQSRIDFAEAALALQYIANRYVDLAGIDPALDISGEPALLALGADFQQHMDKLERRYGEDPFYRDAMHVLRTAWMFIAPALSSAHQAPVPVLVSRYTGLATDALLPVYTGKLRQPSPLND